MENLKLYIAKDNYVNYLQTFDKNVKNNKKDGQPRPYVGIVLDINSFKYYIPLCSAKHPKHDDMQDTLDFIRIDVNGKLVGILNLSSMIPIPDSEIELMNIDFRGSAYRCLIEEEIKVIRKKKDIIFRNASQLYKKITRFRNEPQNKSLAKRCCNYLLLEEKMKDYILLKQIGEIKEEVAIAKDIHIK